MIIGALLASIGGLAIFIISFFTVSLFKSNIGSTLRLFSLLLGLSGLENMVESVCRGENRIGSLSLFRIGVKTFHILLILAFVLAGTYGFTISLMVNLVSILAAAILLIFSVKPLFSGFRKSLTKVMRDVRSFGWNTYLGSIASSASYRTDSLMISAFSTEAAVGFYNLGNLLTLPMVSFSRALTTTLFKDFAQQNRIPRQVLQVNFLWLALSASGLTILRKLFIHLMFGRKYEPVIELVFPLAAAAVCAGLALPYNMFLAAKGMGQYIRNISFIVTGANIGLNILLIPRYGSLGASYASLLAMATNLTLFLFFYRRTLLRVREKGLGTDSTTRDQ
jgi:O-antigen/teichoic acid export membrane protein